MTESTAIIGTPADTPDVLIVEDVNDAADVATGLGCGDDNPYQ